MRFHISLRTGQVSKRECYTMEINSEIAVDAHFVFADVMQRPPRGVDPGDIRGNSAGFADFCGQFLARYGVIGPLLHFRGKIHVERPTGFVTSPPS